MQNRPLVFFPAFVLRCCSLEVYTQVGSRKQEILVRRMSRLEFQTCSYRSVPTKADRLCIASFFGSMIDPCLLSMYSTVL